MDMNSHLRNLSLDEVGLMDAPTTASCQLDFGKSLDLDFVPH